MSLVNVKDSLKSVKLDEVVSVEFDGDELNLSEFKESFGLSNVVYWNDYGFCVGGEVYQGVVDGISKIEGGYKVSFINY